MKTEEQKELLMIAYYFPPIKSMGSIRSYNIAQQFKKHFAKVHVAVSKNRHVLPQDPLPTSDFNILELPTVDYRTLSNLKKEKHVHYSEARKAGLLGKTAVKALNSFPFNLVIGEGGIVYSLAGFFKCRALIKKHKITHIYSSFRPYSDHFTAYLLKTYYPSLIWIADFRDIHIDPLKDNVYLTNYQHWCNKYLLAKADAVCTVSKGTKVHLDQYVKEVYVLPNGTHDLLKPSATAKPFDKFTISYTGSMYGRRRNPTLLLKVLAKLIQTGQIAANTIEIVHAGKDAAIWQTWIEEYNLENIFNNRGLIPMSEAVDIQHNSHMNLLLSFAIPEVTGGLTGKLYEYFAAKRPILLIINGSQDEEFEEIFEELAAGLVTYHQNEKDEKLLEAFLLKYYQEWVTTGTVKASIRAEALKKYEWDNMIPRFLQYLEKLQNEQASV
ncbi:MAG: hypothetical protein AB8G15_08545 [Saprospiraceae bacterium]